jgi:transcriptional regulator with XRE-family HTH domain
MSVLGNNLSRFLEERGLSRREFAYLVDTDQGTVGRWINGEREPSAAMLLRIAQALTISTDEILKAPDGVVKEVRAKYTAGQSFTRWFLDLRTTWQRDPRTHPRIELGLRSTWPNHADEIINWLESEK